MIVDLKLYPEYKPSGVEWLGDVPDHWEVRRLKYAARLIMGQSPSSDDCSTEPIGLPFLQGCAEFGAEHPRPEQFCREPAKTAPAEAILVSVRAPVGRLNVADQPYGIGRGLCAILPNEWLFNAKFARYLIASSVHGLAIASTGSTYDAVSIGDIGNQSSLLPPLSEQAAIVRFLDHADRRIRRYIHAKQKLVKLLEEQKQVIIHRAVTCGLDPNVRLKPSGVEWLGDVPTHWEVMRCRYLFQEVDRRSVDGTEEHLSMSQRLGLVPSHLVENRTLVSENYTGGKLCEIGDIVLNRLKAHLGVFALAYYSGVISPDYTVLRPIKPEGVAYFETVLRSSACRIELRIRAKGIVEGFWRLYTDDFYDIRLPVPPPRERDQIINYIQNTKKEVDQTISVTHREITLLHEYHTRLIADVVTGKLDVREAAARLPDEPDDAPELLDEIEPISEEEEEAGAVEVVEE